MSNPARRPYSPCTASGPPSLDVPTGILQRAAWRDNYALTHMVRARGGAVLGRALRVTLDRAYRQQAQIIRSLPQSLPLALKTDPHRISMKIPSVSRTRSGLRRPAPRSTMVTPATRPFFQGNLQTESMSTLLLFLFSVFRSTPFDPSSVVMLGELEEIPQGDKPQAKTGGNVATLLT